MSVKQCESWRVAALLLVFLAGLLDVASAGVQVGGATTSVPMSFSISSGGDASVYEVTADETASSFSFPLSFSFSPLKRLSTSLGTSYEQTDAVSGLTDVSLSVRVVAVPRNVYPGLAFNLGVGLPTGAKELVGSDNELDAFLSITSGIKIRAFTLDVMTGAMYLGEKWRDDQLAINYGASFGLFSVVYLELVGDTYGEGSQKAYVSVAIKAVTLSAGTSLSNEGSNFIGKVGFCLSFGGKE